MSSIDQQSNQNYDYKMGELFDKLQEKVSKKKLEEYMLKKFSNIPNSYLNRTSMNV